jgi:hypothetical protein
MPAKPVPEEDPARERKVAQRGSRAQWQLVAVRKCRFLYFGDSALAVHNTPDVREYMAIGVINDEEVGQMSEIKEVVYAG